MSEFVSLFDCADDPKVLSSIKEEVLSMKGELKAKMDKGLTPDEMKVAKLKEEAILAAERILEK